MIGYIGEQSEKCIDVWDTKRNDRSVQIVAVAGK